ncbi:Ni/Fe hydrogenase subunit alpha [Archaeoglobales archaeon]|nr:MAG: Ni/Fe hydrogenase subunit alpha [Archaeoglobales archaeon]
MGKKIVIDPTTRLEGHAKVQIFLDDEGNVTDVQFNTIDLRGFERFCIGRPVEELPRITPRICGVCPWAHHMASAKATDAVFGVDIPEAAKKIRELAYSIYFIEDHTLHFYFLAGPDFIMGPDADYNERNIVGIAKKVPDIAKRVIKMRWMAQMMCQTLGGRAIHPVSAVPGGWSRPITKDEAEKMKEQIRELLDFAVFSIKYAKENIFPNYIDEIKNLGVIKTSFLGLVKDGKMNFYDGTLRIIHADGSTEEFAPSDYLDYISEKVMPWTYMKFPYYKKAGDFSMDLENPIGIYRVNALARINVCDEIATPLANEELKEFRKEFGRPAQQPLLYHWARLINLLYAAERAAELIEDPDITKSSKEIRVKVEPKAGRGVGVVEAPRGTLIHDYETDENGLIKDVNLIVATQQNNAGIHMAMKKAAMQLIKNGKYDQGILNRIEMMYRAYDPCLACATHNLVGKVEIVDSKGKVIEILTKG